MDPGEEKSPAKNKGFLTAKKEAEEIVQDKDKLNNLVTKAWKKWKAVEDSNPYFKNLKETFRTFLKMIRSYIRGEYQEIPWMSLVLMVAGILYFITPLDFIPDFIPVTGFIDDLALLTAIVKSIQKDIDQYLKWEKEGQTSH